MHSSLKLDVVSVAHVSIFTGVFLNLEALSHPGNYLRVRRYSEMHNHRRTFGLFRSANVVFDLRIR